VGGNVEFPFKVLPPPPLHTPEVLNLEPLWIGALQYNIIQQFELFACNIRYMEIYSLQTIKSDFFLRKLSFFIHELILGAWQESDVLWEIQECNCPYFSRSFL
jgi:hypothetical protein